MPNDNASRTLRGKMLSLGMGEGEVFVYRDILARFDREEVEKEIKSDTVFLARNTAAAALLEVGGKGSHAALFAREIGLPCVAGLKGLLNTLSENAFAIVDADEAEAIINPTPKQREAFRAKREQRKTTITQARTRAHKPAVTR